MDLPCQCWQLVALGLNWHDHLKVYECLWGLLGEPLMLSMVSKDRGQEAFKDSARFDGRWNIAAIGETLTLLVVFEDLGHWVQAQNKVEINSCTWQEFVHVPTACLQRSGIAGWEEHCGNMNDREWIMGGGFLTFPWPFGIGWLNFHRLLYSARVWPSSNCLPAKDQALLVGRNPVVIWVINWTWWRVLYRSLSWIFAQALSAEDWSEWPNLSLVVGGNSDNGAEAANRCHWCDHGTAAYPKWKMPNIFG